MGNASSADTNDGMRLRLHSLVNQAPGLTPADVDKIYRCFRKYCVQGTRSVSNDVTLVEESNWKILFGCGAEIIGGENESYSVHALFFRRIAGSRNHSFKYELCK